MRTKSWHCLISSDVLRTCQRTSCTVGNPRNAERNLLRHFPDLSKVFVLRKALDDLVPTALSENSQFNQHMEGLLLQANQSSLELLVQQQAARHAAIAGKISIPR